MRIDINGTYLEEVDKYLKAEYKKAIAEVAEHTYGSFNGLTLGQWIDCSEGRFERVVGEIRGTWLQVYWLRSFVEEAKRFPETLANLSPKMDADEQRAASNLLQTTLVESVMVFARSYFGLPSFKATEGLTIGEVLIAKKAAYNESIFQRRYSKIQLEKAKRK